MTVKFNLRFYTIALGVIGGITLIAFWYLPKRDQSVKLVTDILRQVEDHVDISKQQGEPRIILSIPDAPDESLPIELDIQNHLGSELFLGPVFGSDRILRCIGLRVASADGTLVKQSQLGRDALRPEEDIIVTISGGLEIIKSQEHRKLTVYLKELFVLSPGTYSVSAETMGLRKDDSNSLVGSKLTSNVLQVVVE